MAESGFPTRDEKVPNLAIGYTKMGLYNPNPTQVQRKDNRDALPVRGGPAGGGYSTAGDLLKFAIALQNHTLLSPEYTGIVTTGKVQTGDAPDNKYAYGFGERRANGQRMVGHTGGFPGISASFFMYPDLDYTVVVLSNYDPPDSERVHRKVQALITQV